MEWIHTLKLEAISDNKAARIYILYFSTSAHVYKNVSCHNMRIIQLHYIECYIVFVGFQAAFLLTLTTVHVFYR